ncbi:pseudouridine synthase [Brevibacterium album]|uniref:pseudouridine synthase n=1 Tax=Brevibacterium album TaxID=417948 RepID=UPI0003FFD3EB|nr:pseudouridine synthase [Brevibacterium album]
MRPPLPPREGITAQRLRAPGGTRTHARSHETPPETVGEWLRGDFPEASAAELEALTTTGELTDESGCRVALDSPLVPGGFYFFHRDFPPEERLPVEIGVVHEDAELLVVDKPHFLASTPNGRFVRECAVTRLRVERDEPDLVAIHRLDRVTAGLLVLSRRPETRGAYQTLFQERLIRKTYRALARLPEGGGAGGAEAGARGRSGPEGALAPASGRMLAPGWAACRVSRLHKPEGGRQVLEEPGPPNARTEARLLRVCENGCGSPGGLGSSAGHRGTHPDGAVGEFELHPLTGKTHQLRVHMNAWGMPLVGDPVYPVDLEPDPYDLSSPLQLLASRLEFRDPLTWEPRVFETRLCLGGV